ncbi:hypothetical protein ACE1AT_26210 [Pelatocladus sp. BLCC-F211]|uniref:terpene synthase family protein n=1 Tax=Pelatocladus sp. BLCC-F211 TaxID=3342752 RepID=UPI0035B88E82
METVIIPATFCPFAPQINPHVEAAQLHLSKWVQSFNLVQNKTARQRFMRANFAWFAACTYPSADVHNLSLVSDWFAWLFLIDDQLDDGITGRQLEQVQKVMAELLSVLDDINTSPLLSPHSAHSSIAIASLTDLWQRTFLQSNAIWRQRFFRHVSNCFAAACWEAQNRVQGIIPNEIAYIKKRRDTGAIYICLDLIEIVEHIDLPLYVYNSHMFQQILEATSNVICWCNDIYSLEKEKYLNEHHNLVLVVQYTHRITQQEAINYVSDLISAEVRLFLNLEQQVLALFPMYTQDLQKYLAGMKSWMRGNLDWSSQTKRYNYLAKIVPSETVDYLEKILSTAPGLAHLKRY